MIDSTHLRKRIEATLLFENQLVEEKQLSVLTNIPIGDISSHVDKLNDLYKNSGSVLFVKKTNTAYQLYVNEKFNDELLERYSSKKKKLTKALLETLGIIAYKQPITKAEVEAVRGVNCANYIRHLSDDGFLKVVGKKKTVGKPVMYGTTNKFLVHFGLKTLKDLPSLKEIKTYDFLEENEQ